MVKSLDPKKIKSAQRALEVLEYFSDARPTATVMDIARSMGYPQSSTSELLNCLVSLGYLNRDRDQRTYRPTARVAVIGSSVQPELFRKGRLLAILDHLAEETGGIVSDSLEMARFGRDARPERWWLNGDPVATCLLYTSPSPRD